MKPIHTISPVTARRLVLMRQRLAGPRLSPTAQGIMEIVRDLRYVQIDPINVVAPSHLLVLWSRLGPYSKTDLDTLLWKKKSLFEDWAQCTSIVMTEDYPIFKALKRGFAAGDSPRDKKVQAWIEKNSDLQRYLINEMRRHGPLPLRYFEDRAAEDWQSTGWTKGRNVSMMLYFLWAQGKVMVAGRNGNDKLWDLTERHLPSWTPREVLSDRELTRRAAQISLRALGVAREIHIRRHFIRGCYPNLSHALNELESEGIIQRVQVGEGKNMWRGKWYVHSDDLALLEQLETEEWTTRTTLLSPFDNLISDRSRTEQLFSFKFSLEIYVPKPKRRYGYYVMPILYGDRLIGRVDPNMDRKHKTLTVNAVYVEPNAPRTKEAAQAVVGAVKELGVFLGAKTIAYSQRVPPSWKHTLQ